VRFFLIVYDRAEGHLVDLREYTEDREEEAVADRLALELRNAGNGGIEVVILGAESLDDAKRTHARYFQSAGDIVASRF